MDYTAPDPSVPYFFKANFNDADNATLFQRTVEKVNVQQHLYHMLIVSLLVC